VLRSHRWLALLVLSLAALVPLEQPSRSQAPVPEPLRTAGDRAIDIEHIRLDLKVDFPRKTVDARATLNLHSLRSIASITLDAVGFEVQRVTLGTEAKDGDAVPFSHDGQKLTIDLDPAWPVNHVATLRIDYRIREPKAGLHFFGPTEVEPDVPLTVWSQGEPTSNRYWIPCLDQPNQRQTTELVVTVADGFEVLSNGALLSRKENGNKTVTYHWKQEKSHAAYLVTLVVGQFDVVKEDWQGLPVLYYVPKGRKPDVARTFGRTREMLAFFSKRFGMAYPWEKYAQVVVEQFSGGGMENTSATTLTDRALLDERAFLDSSPDGLIAHELGHQWWGDLVTCRDWAHLWLNEGFATFCEVIWAEHHQGADEGAYLLLQKARSAMAGDKERPVVDRRYPSARSMFDARAYPKGGWLLHMLRRQLGEDAFWMGIHAYGEEHKLKTVETNDLRRVLERESGRSLERFFYDWAERPGHPVLEIATDYLPETKQARVAVKQTQAGEAFHLPLVVGFRCAGSSRPVIVKLSLEEKEQVFFVPLPGRPTLVEVDPEQALLAEIKETKSHELWVAQLREGHDVAGRARAAEQLGRTKTPADREALTQALATEKFWGVQVEIVGALGESGGEASRNALIEGLKQTNPRVRRACAEQLGKFRRDAQAAAALKELLRKGDESYFVEAASLGAYAKMEQADAVALLLPWLAKPSHNDVLRSAALHGLGQTQDLTALDTLTTWTQRGKPRATRIAALQALGELIRRANAGDEQRRQAVHSVAACLEGETSPVRLAAVGVLRDLGRTATPTLAALEALGRHDPDERVRDLARKAGEQVRTNTPAPVEVTRLREELERLKKANDALRERLDRFEKMERK
jgi:aminopeptidase N